MEMKYVLPEYIVYKSQAGHTERYAKMFAEETGLPIMTQKEAMKKLAKDSKIIYFGWINTNIIQGYKEARGKFEICAVVSVGMFGRGTGVAALRKVSGIKSEIPLFPLKGGLDMKKLNLFYRVMMGSMRGAVVSEFERKQNPTPLEKDMLRTVKFGGDFVKMKNLEIVLDWYRTGAYEEQDYFDDFSGYYGTYGDEEDIEEAFEETIGAAEETTDEE